MDTFLSIHPADIIGTLSTFASMLSKGYRSISMEEMRAPVPRRAVTPFPLTRRRAPDFIVCFARQLQDLKSKPRFLGDRGSCFNVQP